MLFSGILFPSFSVTDVAALNFLCFLLEENIQVCISKQIYVGTSSMCSGAPQASEHPCQTEAVLRGLQSWAKPTLLQV